jgi:hypothetical protein
MDFNKMFTFNFFTFNYKNIIDDLKNFILLYLKYNFKKYNSNKVPNDYIIKSSDKIYKDSVLITHESSSFIFEKTRKYLPKFYFIQLISDDRYPTHSFNIYKDKQFFYLVDMSFKNCYGIHKFKTLNDCLLFELCNLIKYFNFEGDIKYICYETIPNTNNTVTEFVNKCYDGERIFISNGVNKKNYGNKFIF